MKYIQYLLVATCAICAQRPAFAEEKADAVRKANSVGLTEIEVKNLGIETAAVVPTEFEETIFSLGRIEAISSKRAIVSSRIPGRIVKLGAFEGDVVTAGQVVATIESRQPGNPPPTTTLRAPLGGLVMSTHSSLGEPIEPDTDILEIIDLSEVYAVARVPEDQAGKIRPGTPARIFIPAFPEESFEGELLRFGTTADRASGTIDAIFHLKGLDGHIRPAMRAEFSIVLSSRENVMAVPKEALQGDNVAPFVFVKDFELKNVFVKAPLRVGARNDRFVEVIGGLFPGDEVVTKGAYPLAFAGEGSVSLKDALDQAHGHEHNEDGSELTASQKSAGEGGDGGGATDFGPMVMFLGILCVLLAGLLVLSLVFRSKSQTENDDA